MNKTSSQKQIQNDSNEKKINSGNGSPIAKKNSYPSKNGGASTHRSQNSPNFNNNHEQSVTKGETDWGNRLSTI